MKFSTNIHYDLVPRPRNIHYGIKLDLDNNKTLPKVVLSVYKNVEKAPMNALKRSEGKSRVKYNIILMYIESII